MKSLFFIAALCGLGLSTSAFATSVHSPLFTYDLNRLLDELEKSGATTMEEALPVLPAALRANFTLQYKAGGLQAADEQRPRAILFTNDGKFALTFNGDDSQGKGDQWEILQYNEKSDSKKLSIELENQAPRPAFELYSLSFPLKRNLSGQIERPEKNPAVCLQCHGQDPKPIWGRYDEWHGIFQEDQDVASDQEKAALKAFLASRAQHPRYQSLAPETGSALSPYFPVEEKYILGDGFPYLLFLPNSRLMFALAASNALKITARFQQSPYYKELLPLLVLTTNVVRRAFIDDKNTHMIHPACGHPRDVQADWGWTPEDVQRLERVVRRVLYQQYANALPYPEDSPLSDRSIFAAFGVRFKELFTMIKDNEELPDPSTDPQGGENYIGLGRFRSSWVNSNQHFVDLLKANRGLVTKVYFRTDSTESFFYDFQRHWFLNTDYDLPLVRLWDSYGISTTIEPGSDCKAIYDILRNNLQKLDANH